MWYSWKEIISNEMVDRRWGAARAYKVFIHYERSVTMTKSKRTALEKECIKFDIVHIMEQYKSKLSMRYKNPKIHHLARLVYSDYLRYTKSVDWICTCVTCGSKLPRNSQYMHPWHFRTAGTSLLWKFADNNVRPQCARCNVMLNGNYAKYTLFMIDKFWKEYTEFLLNDNTTTDIKNFKYAKMISERYVIIKYDI